MKNRNLYSRRTTPFIFCAGFTLVEVLVSVVILALGILGTIAMQARGLMDNQDAYLRTQAIFLAYDMSDRMRANVQGWGADLDPVASNCNSEASNCTASDMAADDLSHWQQEVQKKLLNGQGGVQRNGSMCSGDAAIGIRVEVTWERANKDVNNRLGNACFSLDVVLPQS